MPATLAFRTSAFLALVPLLLSPLFGDVTVEPLAWRSVPAGVTLFTTLPAERTGISCINRYDDPRIWNERYHEFSVGAIGTGIAMGDYDGDGKTDVFVSNKTESCRLYRNLGDFKFEDVTERAGLLQTGAEAREWKQGVAFADVNGDGKLDLYVCRFGARNLLYINQGNGTFREEAETRGLALVEASGVASFCDYDRDGWLDVYVQTNILDAAARPGGQPDHLFHNKGGGFFEEVSQRAGISGESQGHSATWWDYDGDGWPDLYVANDFAAPDHLYRNNHDGTFTDVINTAVPVMPYHSMGADVGDLNGDGRLDFLVADMARTFLVRERATIADTRARSRYQARPGEAPQVMRNTLFLATGTPYCLEAAQIAGLAATDWTWSVRLEDLDNDGRVDVHITNGMVRDYDSVDLRNRTMAAESSSERVRIMQTSPASVDRHLAYRNCGDMRFEDVSDAWGLAQRAVSFGAAFGDLDGDGDLDLVFANYQAAPTVLRNDGLTGHRLVVVLRSDTPNRFGVGAVVRLVNRAGTQVRQLGSARGYLSTSEPIAHFGLGDETAIERLEVLWPDGNRQVIEAPPVDSRITISEESEHAATSASSNLPWFEEKTGSLNLVHKDEEPRRSETEEEQPLVSLRFEGQGPALASGDLDGDGHADIVVGGDGISPLSLWRGEGAGHWSEAIPLAHPEAGALPDGPLALLDANGDGSLDLLVTKRGVSAVAGSPAFQPRLLINDGKGSFHEEPNRLPALPVFAGAVAVGDFDRDGEPDLFMGGRLELGRYPLSPRSALWMNRRDHFEDVTATEAPGLSRVGMVAAALVWDVDGDGWQDLVLALDWGTPRYWHNDQGKGWTDRSNEAGFAQAGSGAWSALAAGDFNGDGKPDFVLGNRGLNTAYTASEKDPQEILYGDFGERFGPVALEAFSRDGVVYPWATRRQLTALWPGLARRFPRNDLFARASLAEVVGGEARLQSAQIWKETELSSGVLLSEPGGTWRFEAFPRSAQLSPVQAVGVGDFDGDGRLDLVLIQNSHAPLARLGRFTGGLGQLLCWKVDGTFRPVPVDESGLVVPGDGKGVLVLDLNGDGVEDLFISRNNATTLAFIRSVTTPRR